MSLSKVYFKSKPVCKVTFSLPKKAVNGTKKVQLLGDFNHWKIKDAIHMKLKKHKFTGTVELPLNQEFQFRYLLDGEIWENDWKADRYTPNHLGSENSIVHTSKS